MTDLLPSFSAPCLAVLQRFDAGRPRAPGAGQEVLFLSVSDGSERALTVSGRGADVSAAWQDAWAKWRQRQGGDAAVPRWVRADRVVQVHAGTWGQVRRLLAGTKTNYFALGIAWDEALTQACLPEELWAHACLYSGDINACVPNDVNLRAFSRARWGRETGWPQDDAAPLWLFQTKGVFVEGDGPVLTLDNEGVMDRIRRIGQPDAAMVAEAVQHSADFLARQVTPSGRWVYGWYPCFDRPVPSYNALRHASAAYSLLEAWDLTRQPAHLEAATRAIDHLCRELVHPVAVPAGEAPVAYLVDEEAEIKLGGNGVAILAIAKRIGLTGEPRHLDLIRPLAEGLLRMQDATTGAFVHVLTFPSLALKEAHRTVYYDGEAAFGLLKAHELTGDHRYLAAVGRAAEHFIQAQHWRSHDHWLAYALNELTRHAPQERYFRLGLKNVSRHLGFIRQRITAYPTLLELMMAARAMLDRMDSLGLEPLALDPGFDRQAFDLALHHRARHLFSGYCFPELAMFFRRPARICNTFFIRHYSFRVRIDDVQHCISGLVAYHQRFLSGAQAPSPSPGPAVWASP
ncbi:MAG: Mur ligase [Hydrogenophaga sp.]|uniref:Mur ligase n=1 Tax=Hydrogenophaga sp. TaxID=1904254 RepID=UPI0025C0112F|nr:Mur ligase [Hydrogenophaga sp.]MBT9554245.1 Mur ligase [Hydrogenophaga sp.]